MAFWNQAISQLTAPSRLLRSQDELSRRLDMVQRSLQQQYAALDTRARNQEQQTGQLESEFDSLRRQIENDRKSEQKWNTGDNIATAVALIALLVWGGVAVVASVRRTDIGIDIEAVNKWTAFVTLCCALVAMATSRLPKLVAVLTCAAAVTGLLSAILPDTHEYWDGQETIVCSSDISKLQENQYDEALERLKTHTGQGTQILLCTPADATNVQGPEDADD